MKKQAARKYPGWSKPVDWSEPRQYRPAVPVWCAMLDSDGRRCTKAARWRAAVHGNAEYDQHWYGVPFCDDHKAGADSPRIEHER